MSMKIEKLLFRVFVNLLEGYPITTSIVNKGKEKKVIFLAVAPSVVEESDEINDYEILFDYSTTENLLGSLEMITGTIGTLKNRIDQRESEDFSETFDELIRLSRAVHAHRIESISTVLQTGNTDDFEKNLDDTCEEKDVEVDDRYVWRVCEDEGIAD